MSGLGMFFLKDIDRRYEYETNMINFGTNIYLNMKKVIRQEQLHVNVYCTSFALLQQGQQHMLECTHVPRRAIAIFCCYSVVVDDSVI